MSNDKDLIQEAEELQQLGLAIGEKRDSKLDKMIKNHKQQQSPQRFKQPKKQTAFDPTQEIRIMKFEADMPVPEKIPKWKQFICKLIKVVPNQKVYTRGYVYLDNKTALWPGAVIRTKEMAIDLVLMGNIDGNKYLYASVTGTDNPGQLYNETRATYVGTTQLSKPQPKQNGNAKNKEENSKEVTGSEEIS